MKIGSGVIDAKKSTPHLENALKPAQAERLDRDLREYEHYQRLEFGNERRSWPLRDLIDRREALAEDLMSGDVMTVHYRRLRAELHAIEDEIKRRREGTT